MAPPPPIPPQSNSSQSSSTQFSPAQSSPTQPSGNKVESQSSWQPIVLAVLLTAAVTGAVSFFLARPEPPPIEIHPPPTIGVTTAPEVTAAPVNILVFVSGAVRQPGVYELRTDSRVVDALEAAGGFAEEANVDAINQAERLQDGVQVHVPSVEEDVPTPLAGVTGSTFSNSIAADATKVHLNSATLAELESLPGIGSVKAEAIVEGRPYSSIEELEEVSGIGPKTVDALRDLVDLQ